MAKVKPAPEPGEDWQFGVDWSAYPKLAAGTLNCELNRRRVCALHRIGDVPVHEHRRVLIQSMWPQEEWHEWSERRVKSISYSNFVIWHGPASCVDGDTVIYSPSGKSKTIRELEESGEAPVVMTLEGPEQAEPPFIKGCEEMYEVTLSSGLCCSMTGEHRLLTQQGYRRVDLLRIGDSVAAWESGRVSSKTPLFFSYHPHSILDTCSSVHGQDDRGSQRITEDWKGRCSTYFHPGDEQPPSDQGIVQSCAPLRVDAQERSRSACSHKGDQGNGFVHSRDSSFCLPSNGRSSLFLVRTLETRKPLASRGTPLPFYEKYQHEGLLNKGNPHSSIAPESARDERSRRCFLDTCVRHQLDQSWGVKVQDSKVVSIRRTEKRTVYDLTVPKAGHYFANGLIHHNSAKSADAAKMAIEYWLESPHNTSVIVCSTTMQSLRRRIWAEVVSHFKQIDGKMGGYVGELLDASCIVRWEPGDSRHGIFGVAVEDGPVEDAVNNLVGFHPKRYFLILDEMQGVREAIMSHRLLSNITKNPEAKFLGMGNPSNLMSLLCRHAAPVNGGWAGIEKFSPSWEIDNHGFQGRGVCLFFDGRKSPACLDPDFARRNPWMINQKMLDADLARAGGNENDPAYMEQSIGWPPEKGLESTVLDASILVQFKCQQKPIWTDGFTMCACLDPAFGGGDSIVLQFGKRGFVNDAEGKRWIIGFDETLEVPIDSASPRPIHYQISDYVKGQCAKRGIPATETAVLAAGEGGGLVSIMQIEFGPVVAIEEGGRPSERVADERGKTAREKYDTRASELQFGLRDFALGNGIRGLPDKTASQACQRITFDKNGKWAAEPKCGSKGRSDAAGRAAKGFKERLGFSPGELDAAAGLVEHCRLKGAEPAFAMGSPKIDQDWSKEVQTAGELYSEEQYKEAPDWKAEADQFAGYSMSGLS